MRHLERLSGRSPIYKAGFETGFDRGYMEGFGKRTRQDAYLLWLAIMLGIELGVILSLVVVGYYRYYY